MAKQQKQASRMKSFLRHLYAPLWRDDLLVRVTCFLAGALAAGGIGVPMLVSGATTHDLEGSMFVRFFYFAVAIVFTGYGLAMLSRCVLSARSRTARILDRLFPDAVGLEGGLLVLLIYLPAALLTLFLRYFGVKGQRIDWDRVGSSGPN